MVLFHWIHLSNASFGRIVLDTAVLSSRALALVVLRVQPQKRYFSFFPVPLPLTLSLEASALSLLCQFGLNARLTSLHSVASVRKDQIFRLLRSFDLKWRFSTIVSSGCFSMARRALLPRCIEGLHVTIPEVHSADVVEIQEVVAGDDDIEGPE